MDYKSTSKYALNDSAGEEHEEAGSSSEKAPKEKPSTSKRPSKLSTVKKHDDICYTFQDMPPSSKETLEIVHHEPVYELPIPTNPKYKHLSVAERAKLLNDYWLKIWQLQAKLAGKSLRRAPFSSPILPSDDCKDSLLKSPGGESDSAREHIPTQDFYISRHGRQVKRKTYTEDAENDCDSDSDFASPLKKNKSVINSDTKIILDTPYVPEEHHNEETGTPKSLNKSKKRNMPRAEELFENLKKEEEKQRQKEMEMAAFERTLPSTLEDDEGNVVLIDDGSPVKEASSEEKDESFVKRRVVPPVPTKKSSKPKQLSQEEDFGKIDVVPSTPPDSPVLKQYGSLKKNITKRRPPIKSKAKKATEDQPKINCPICGKEFVQSEIEDHAANCDNFESGDGEFQEEKTESGNRIMCELCDRVFLVNEEYEEHVKQCIARKVQDM